jgi:hypothetical protein
MKGQAWAVGKCSLPCRPQMTLATEDKKHRSSQRANHHMKSEKSIGAGSQLSDGQQIRLHHSPATSEHLGILCATQWSVEKNLTGVFLSCLCSIAQASAQ